MNSKYNFVLVLAGIFLIVSGVYAINYLVTPDSTSVLSSRELVEKVAANSDTEQAENVVGRNETFCIEDRCYEVREELTELYDSEVLRFENNHLASLVTATKIYVVDGPKMLSGSVYVNLPSFVVLEYFNYDSQNGFTHAGELKTIGAQPSWVTLKATALRGGEKQEELYYNLGRATDPGRNETEGVIFKKDGEFIDLEIPDILGETIESKEGTFVLRDYSNIYNAPLTEFYGRWIRHGVSESTYLISTLPLYHFYEDEEHVLTALVYFIIDESAQFKKVYSSICNIESETMESCFSRDVRNLESQ